MQISTKGNGKLVRVSGISSNPEFELTRGYTEVVFLCWYIHNQNVEVKNIVVFRN